MRIAPGSGPRLLLVGGELFSAELAARCRTWFGGTMVNVYGPTETTVDVTVVGARHGCRDRSQRAHRPSDFGVGGAGAYGSGLAVPPGVPGELYVGGAGRRGGTWGGGG